MDPLIPTVPLIPNNNDIATVQEDIVATQEGFIAAAKEDIVHLLADVIQTLSKFEFVASVAHDDTGHYVDALLAYEDARVAYIEAVDMQIVEVLGMQQ